MLSNVLFFMNFSSAIWDNYPWLSEPINWYLSLSGWMMAFVTIFGILGFYLFFRITFKIIEGIAGLFN